MDGYRVFSGCALGSFCSTLPCRISPGVTDEQALVLLQTANYFTRMLIVTERAATTKALGLQVEQMRADDLFLAGMSTEDLKAIKELFGVIDDFCN